MHSSKDALHGGRHFQSHEWTEKTSDSATIHKKGFLQDYMLLLVVSIIFLLLLFLFFLMFNELKYRARVRTGHSTGESGSHSGRSFLRANAGNRVRQQMRYHNSA
ncbi:uncharacterized protein LOC135388378 [Ornithodoros turicata]|uniref:uncharacterized protein LOC135388378 n=1 Tax=Ornithodoros turicata TaxID=34597 RepID=UPI003138C9D4